MNRREFLTTGAGASALAVSLSGCLFGGGSECGHGIIFDVDGPLTDAEIAAAESRTPNDLPPRARRLVETAAEQGAATYTGPQEPPLEPGTVVHLEGIYYRVTVEKVDSTTVTGYEYGVVTNSTVRESATPADTITFDELPSHDQQTFLAAFDGKAGGIRDHQIDELDVEMLAAYASEDARNESVFVPDLKYQYVRYGENVFRLDPQGTREVTVDTYRVELHTKAESTTDYAEQIRVTEGTVVDPASLSEKAREFVQRGMGADQEATACFPLPDHVTEVMNAFELDAERPHDSQFVDYGGDWYRATVSEFHAD